MARNPDLVSLLGKVREPQNVSHAYATPSDCISCAVSRREDDGPASGEHVGVETILILEDELPFTRVLADALEDERVLTNSTLKCRHFVLNLLLIFKASLNLINDVLLCCFTLGHPRFHVGVRSVHVIDLCGQVAVDLFLIQKFWRIKGADNVIGLSSNHASRGRRDVRSHVSAALQSNHLHTLGIGDLLEVGKLLRCRFSYRPLGLYEQLR